MNELSNWRTRAESLGRVRVFVHDKPTDMRKSFDTLAALVTASKRDAMTGELFLFVGKDRRRAKVLFFDGTGLCVFAKRLSRGTFGAIWEARGARAAPRVIGSTRRVRVFVQTSRRTCARASTRSR